MNPEAVITSKDVLNFFANTTLDRIVLFIFFTLIVLILLNGRKDRKEFSNSCKGLEVSVGKLSTSITKSLTTDEEKDKKYMQEFKNLNVTLSKLDSSINQLRTSIAGLHNYCMGRNGFPTHREGDE
jgi:hypothetical protein